MRLDQRHQGLRAHGARLLRGRTGIVAALVVYSLVLVAAGAYLRGTGVFGRGKELVGQGLRSLPAVLSGLLADPERLTIDIAYKDVERLAAKRAEALELGHLFAKPGDYVPAEIRHGGQSVRVELRLKGDLLDHLRGRKWSYRVHVKGNATLLGMKRFSLHHPATRNYVAEWLSQRAMQREDVAALRYRFVAVTVNGEDFGIYALEEHFGKRLLEHNRRREAPIVRFNEDAMWREMAQQEDRFPEAAPSGAGSYAAAEVDGFQTGKLLADPGLRAELEHASGLLERFRAGDLATHEVFDTTALARYFALVDLLGAEHGARWHNARFYYDSLSGKLAPIAFDGDAGGPVRCLCGLLEGAWLGAAGAPDADRYYARLFRDRTFFEAYVAQLQRVSAAGYVERLLRDLGPGLERQLAILHSEFPLYRFDTGVLRQNAAYIRSVLQPVRAALVYATPDGDDLRLELGAVQGMPVEVAEVRGAGHVLARLDPALLLPGRQPGQLVGWRELVVRGAGAIAPGDLVVRGTLVGAAASRPLTVLRGPRIPPAAGRVGVPRPATLAELSQRELLVVDEAGHRIGFRPGHWRIERDLVLPAGFEIVGTGGTTLDLTHGAVLLSYSPVELTGSRDAPFRIVSSDGSGQGLVVLQAPRRSTLAGVELRVLFAPHRRGWQLTGAVTFYESDVTVDRCVFQDLHSEDALNVVRAAFDVDGSRFEDIASDGLDADFCEGRIRNTTFHRIHNDAIDVSGTVATVEDVQVDGAGDKAISAGEGSDVTARRLLARFCKIGIASKDLSRVLAYRPRIENSRFGFVAFQKKPEFGPGEITAHADDDPCRDVATPYLIEVGSTMQLGSRAIAASARHVLAQISAAEAPERPRMTAWRYERKFRVDGVSLADVEMVIRLHPAGFRRLYPPRDVNNVYYDDPALHGYFDNVDGLHERTKIRMRWYGALHGRHQPALEIKTKRGLLGSKRCLQLSVRVLAPSAPPAAPARLLRSAEVGGAPLAEALPDLAALRPVLVNRYHRRYYGSTDGRFRLTVDDRLEYRGLGCHGMPALRRHRDPTGIVLELKYASHDDRDARRITSRLPFRMSRSSKYVTGVELLKRGF